MTLFTAFIVEDDGVVVWSGPELLREIDARKGATIGEKASAAKAPSSRWRNVSLSDPIHLLLFRFPTLGTGTDVAMESAGAAEGRFGWHRSRASSLPSDHAQYSPESFLCVHL